MSTDTHDLCQITPKQASEQYVIRFHLWEQWNRLCRMQMLSSIVFPVRTIAILYAEIIIGAVLVGGGAT